MQKNVIIIIAVIVLAAAAIGGAWYYFAGSDSIAPNNNQDQELFTASKTDDSQPSEAMVQDLPDVVAKVNGQEIGKAELQQAEAQILAAQQIDPSTLDAQTLEQLRTQALNNLVSNTLVKQAAAVAETTVEESAVDTQIDNIKNQFSEEGQFESMLDQQNLTQDELRNLVTSDLEIQSYLEGALGLADISASEKEIADFYAQQASSSEQELPPLEEVSGQIGNMLIQQKQQQAIMSHLTELRNNAEIELFI